MAVEYLPLSAVIPPGSPCRGDEMVAGQFLVLIEVILTAKDVFKWTKNSLNDIGLRVIVVVGHHLVVDRLAEVRAG